MEILVLEASTVSAKASVFDFERGVLSACSEPVCSNEREAAEHDVKRVLRTIYEVGARAAAGHTISAIGCVCTGHSSLLVDRDVQPLSPAYMWMYQFGSGLTRGIREDRELTRKLYRESGCMVHNIYPLYRCIYQRDVLKLPVSTSSIISEGAYLYYHLTGERLESQTTAAASAFCDIHTLTWSEKIREFSGISTEQFFPICSNHYAAPLSPAAAEKLGVRAGIPVSVPLIDGALNQLGAGMIEPGSMTISIGTSGAMRITNEVPLLPESMATWCYHTLDAYLCGATISGATNCVDWFRNGYLQGIGYDRLEEMIRPPEKSAPIFLPFLFGERCPRWRDERAGGFFDLLGSHQPAELYTAILEGIVFNLYQNYDILRDLSGTVEKINLSGGVLHSPRWTQMVADIFGHEMIINRFEQAASVGAACMAFEKCGAVASAKDYRLPEDTNRLVRPDRERHERYLERFARYLEIYEKNE